MRGRTETRRRGRSSRASARLFGVALAALLAVLAMTASSAFALTQRGHVFGSAFASEGSGNGQLLNPGGIAVNDATGDIYVVDRGNNRLVRFNSKGEFIAAWGWGVKQAGGKEFQVCTAAAKEECKAGTAGHGKNQFEEAEGIAIDNAKGSPSVGDVYVEANTSEEHSVVDKFSAEGTELAQIKSGKEKGETAEKFEELQGVAVDPTGALYIYDAGAIYGYTNGLPNKPVTRVEAGFEGSARPGIAVDSHDNFYVAHDAAGSGEVPTAIAKLESNGEALIEEIDAENGTGLAVDASNELFVVHSANVALYGSSGNLLERFGAGSITGGSGIAVASTTGNVYVADASTGRVEVFTPEPVAAPKTDELGVEKIAATSAEFSAQLNPTGAASTYAFRYSTEAVPVAGEACSGSCVEVPTPEASIGGGFGDVPVTAPIAGLTPSTTYHYRVLARNAQGQTTSEERSFTTQPVSAGSTLSDARQWELVSPEEKNGASIEAISKEGGLIQASEDGTALTYFLYGAIEGAEGSRAPEVAQILSTRGSSAWTSKDLATRNERGEGVRTGHAPEYQAFSTDLSTAVVVPFGNTAIEEPPLNSEATERTPYTRQNSPACDPPTPTPEACFTPLVTSANVPAGTHFGRFVSYVSSTPDLSHMILESTGPALTSTHVISEENLYEWAGGKLALVNILPGAAGPAAVSKLGYENRVVRHAISNDGSRVIWSSYASGIPTHLYMRDMVRGETIQVDKPQAGAVLGTHEVPIFQAASSDGSRIFFTDEQRLTADSTASPESGKEKADLYVCEVVENETTHEHECKLTDLSVDQNVGQSADVQGIVPGISEDGTSIYYVANGQLAAGSEAGHCREDKSALGATCNLYVERYNTESATWGRPTLVSVLSAEDSPDWYSNVPGDLGKITSRVSPGGNLLTFMSARSLTGYNNIDAISGKADEEVYLYNASTEKLVCASCNPTGARPTGVFDTEVSGEGIGLVVDRHLLWANRWLSGNIPGWTSLEVEHALYQSRYLSDSGRLFFNSAEALVPQDTNGKEDVYEYEPAGVGACTPASETYNASSGGCVTLISSGTATTESAFLDASVNGNDAFFLTAAQLVPGDKDSAFDVYDAGVCGQPGTKVCLPPPLATPPSCKEIEGCRPTTPAPSGFPTPATTTPSGSGNVAAGQVLNNKVEVKPVKPLTNAQKLAAALKVCKKDKNKGKRVACEKQARKKYRPVSKKAARKARKSSTGGPRGAKR